MARLAEDHVMIALLDWSLALLPVLLMVGLFVWLDVFKLMNLHEILLLLGLGALAALIAYPISGRVIDALPLGFSFYSRFIAPWIEEGLKAAAVTAIFLANRVGFKLDAVISGFAIGAGFSVVENIFYLVRFPDLAPSVWMVRGLGTALMHGATCAVLAAVVHELSERANRGAAARFHFNPLWLVPGLVLAGLVHTAFNQFPDQPMLAMIGALVGTPLVMMGIFQFGTAEAKAWLTAESAAHRDALGHLRGGEFPEGESGRRIAALCARLGPATGERVRDYLLCELSLLVAAEDKLLGNPVAAAEMRALFERRDGLKRDLGRTTLAALEPLLPFSRNDRWEVAELAEDVKRG